MVLAKSDLFGNNKKTHLLKHSLFLQPAVSHMRHQFVEKAHNMYQRGSYLVIFDSIQSKEIYPVMSKVTYSLHFTSLHLVEPLLPVGVEGLQRALNLSWARAIAKATNQHTEADNINFRIYFLLKLFRWLVQWGLLQCSVTITAFN
jgi:hypothetical protein